jgi:hypothetical protein
VSSRSGRSQVGCPPHRVISTRIVLLYAMEPCDPWRPVRHHVWRNLCFCLVSLTWSVLCPILGDYYEIPQTCPFMTTCPVVCVAKVEDCPTDCATHTSGWNASSATSLCVDGSCEMDCRQHADNPCTCPLFPIACPRVVDFYDDCFAMFQPFYDGNVCPEEEWGPIPQVSTSAFHIVFYTWIGAVTMLMVCWCHYNEKLVPNFTKMSMPLIGGAINPSIEEAWQQHGYRRCIVGVTIYWLVTITIYGIQFLFCFLSVSYFVSVGLITRWSPIFDDPAQVQRLFISVWFVGFVWTMGLSCVRLRTRLDCLFLRRCPLSDATQVLVVAPDTVSKLSSFKSVPWLSLPFSRILRALFPNPHDVPGKKGSFCRVSLDKVSGRRWITYRLRRYVFESSIGGFAPGFIDVGKKLTDFTVQADGLSTNEAARRMGIVGLNKAMIPKPTFLSSLVVEYFRLFYIYQVCIFVGLVL